MSDEANVPRDGIKLSWFLSQLLLVRNQWSKKGQNRKTFHFKFLTHTQNIKTVFYFYTNKDLTFCVDNFNLSTHHEKKNFLFLNVTYQLIFIYCLMFRFFFFINFSIFIHFIILHHKLGVLVHHQGCSSDSHYRTYVYSYHSPPWLVHWSNSLRW